MVCRHHAGRRTAWRFAAPIDLFFCRACGGVAVGDFAGPFHACPRLAFVGGFGHCVAVTPHSVERGGYYLADFWSDRHWTDGGSPAGHRHRLQLHR